jgi:hypothetical protein
VGFMPPSGPGQPLGRELREGVAEAPARGDLRLPSSKLPFTKFDNH